MKNLLNSLCVNWQHHIKKSMSLCTVVFFTSALSSCGGLEEIIQEINGYEPTPTPIPVVPTPEPIAVPTPEPIAVPTPEPIAVPTPEPIAVPTPEPIAVPTPEPIAVPTPEPTLAPVEPTPGPVIVDVTDISMAAFEEYLHAPILRVQICQQCHIENGIAPYAHSDPQVETAFLFASSFTYLDDPYASPMVEKVASGHFCWSIGCEASAAAIADAVANWAAIVGEAVGEGGGVDNNNNGVAGLMTYTTQDAMFGEPEGDTRDNSGVLALYTFLEGTGNTVNDMSGVGQPLNLELEGAFTWLDGGGIQFLQDSKAISTAEASAKLHSAIAGNNGSQAYTIEAWVRSDLENQDGPARLVTYSSNTSNRNFTLGQTVDYVDWRNRNENPDINTNGVPSLNNPNFISLNTELNHIVATYDQVNGRRIYWNSQLIPGDDDIDAAELSNWDSDYIFGLANEMSNEDRQWLGQFYLVAMYNKALNEAQIQTNFEAGVGEKFVVEFDISDLVDTPNTLIQMEAVELGGVAYSFGKPTLITDSSSSLDLPISGVRIAVNDRIALVGQTFSELNTTLTSNGQIISHQGAVLKNDMGKELDTFKLAFEIIGNNSNIYVEEIPTPIAITDDGNPATDISGLRTFDQINDSMSSVTGIEKTRQNINSTFSEIKTSFPTTAEMISFVSSHQVAISKLALEYCDTLVNDNDAREIFFSTVNFEAGVNTALNTSGINAIVDALWENMIGTSMDNQPNENLFKAEIENMLSDLVSTTPNGNAARTRSIITGACTAVLGSSMATVH